MITPLFSGETGLAVSETVALNNLGLGRDEASVQIDITGSATIEVHGRLSVDAEWRTIKTITASEIQPIYRVPYFRMQITANTGSVSAFVAT